MPTEFRDTTATTGTTSEVAGELKQDAAHLKDNVAARAKQEAESRKGAAVLLAGSASSALDSAAQDLRDNADAPDWMASAIQQAARRIESLAHRIEGRSIDQLGEDVSEFARCSPGMFLAASAAAGFAASRVLRAGIDKKRHDREGRAPDQENDAYLRQDWTADENVMPNADGTFTPAFDWDRERPTGESAEGAR
ncbi:MAG: hypothetical protein O9293_04785 [Porphyrobacter sp.]|nr:hypothetical protein [Porphyrobacter sp.]